MHCHRKPLVGVTGVILAGGQSSRMGSNKALLPYRGGRFIEAIYRQLVRHFSELLLVTNYPEQYRFLPCRKVPDIFPGMGALAGLHSGLSHSSTHHIFAVACDMPYLSDTLISDLTALRHTADLVIPESPWGLEPLHAIYARECLPHMTAALQDNRRRIVSFFEKVNVCRFDKGKVAAIDPEFAAFSNINTPEDYFALREGERRSCPDAPFLPAGEPLAEGKLYPAVSYR
jgi:molybdopterin-guanine dinucleotide biosynthesis protein A